jgi:outer membrane receptor protein involved in Fe transport
MLLTETELAIVCKGDIKMIKVMNCASKSKIVLAGCISAMALMVWFLVAIPAVAQMPTGTILGTAKDSSGGVLPNVTVTITNVDTGFKRVVMTGDDGFYRVPELAVGHYEVKGEHSGFKTDTRKGITLEVTQQAVINLDFEVGAAAQVVVVTGEAPMVNTQDATLGGTVNETKMTELPLNGRNYIDLALLQPGVDKDKNQTNSQGGTSFSVNGAPPRSNNFTLDGAILQTMLGRSPVAGASGDALGLDGIKEFQIVAGTFQAEYGLAMGSQMVAVSKNGTNQFHGDVFEYIRNDAFDANTFFNNQAGVPKAPLRKNQFGGAFGGPIKKDKTFFYAVYEGVRETQGVPITNPVPSAGCHPPASAPNFGAGTVILAAQCPDIGSDVTLSPYTAALLALIPLPDPGSTFDTSNGNPPVQTFNDHNSLIENYGQMRFDQTISGKDSFFARYTVDNALQNQTVGDFSYFREAPGARNQWITLAENHIFSPTVFNAVRFSFSRTNALTNKANVGLPGGTGPQLVPGFDTGVVDLNGSGGGAYAEFGSVNAAPQTYNRQNIYTLSDDVNWTRGKHAFKFGVLLNRFNEASQATNSFNGQIVYPTFSDFLQGNPQQVEFAPTFATENRDFIYNTYGLYGQDDWRVKPRLTLNLGLRYEFMNTPHELNGRQSRQINDFTDPFTLGPVIRNNSLKNFSPRVGMAYDLFGNGKTAIRGGAGIYYDMGNIGTALGQTANGSLPFAGLVDVNPTAPNACPVTSGNPPGCIPTITSWENTTVGTTANGFPVPIPDQVRSFYTPDKLGVFTPTFIDYNWKSSYMIQYNASVQQQLPWNMALGVAYVGNHGVHLPMVRDGNPIPATSFGTCGDPASVCIGGKVPIWDNGNNAAYNNLNPNFGSNINVGTAATSRYNALQVVLQKRTSHGLELEAAYTRSRVTDETQGQSNIQDCQTSGGLLGVYPLDNSVDKGPACFNIKNNWEINVLYHFPDVVKGNGFLSKVANGWFISSIVSIQSGQPFSPVVVGNRSNSGVLQGVQGDRPNINTPALIAKYYGVNAQGVPDGHLCTSTPTQAATGPDTNPCAYTPIPYDPNKVITGDPNNWFNGAMFSLPPIALSSSSQPSCVTTPPLPKGCTPNTIGQLGTALRNSLTGPPERNWDFSLVKDTKLGFLGEAGMLEFRAEFFNIMNHPNFSGGTHFNVAIFPGSLNPIPDTGPFSEAPGNGRANAQVQDGQREIQFALRIEF